jgi:hypothetical protein
MNKSILRKIFLVAFASLFAILTGCATPASHTAMTVNKEDIQLKQSTLLKGQMNVSRVAGGKETNPLWTSQVDNQGFKTALEQSLILAGYKAQNPNTAKYQVDALFHAEEVDIVEGTATATEGSCTIFFGLMSPIRLLSSSLNVL